MAEVAVPYLEAGEAAFEVLDEYTQRFLLSGNHPPLAPGYPMRVDADQALSQFHVVGLDADGDLVPATWNADPALAVKAIGVVTQAVVGNSDGTTTVPVFYSGCFNPDALVWDASFDTEGKKMTAFNGSPTPTTITLRKRG
ncbi:head decoration protein [Neoaquamicrobium sediminum]|uniref:head decoration protein n=1 Tax=Neoaquamicrobium sediminum TaxID=1849104 RepID=UPI001565EAA8|nr:head decoration protein [Mesorhizobium sediminum]NRC54119.1 hypothetical protein [Mesorhizobium sediminum]